MEYQNTTDILEGTKETKMKIDIFWQVVIEIISVINFILVMFIFRSAKVKIFGFIKEEASFLNWKRIRKIKRRTKVEKG